MYSKTNRPTTKDFAEFRDALYGKNLPRSTLNNYSFAIKKYHECREIDKVPFSPED